LNYNYTDFAASGVYDPSEDMYLGAPVNIQGANGYRVSGLLSERHSEAFGYPSLPFTIRAGIKISFGGKSWQWK
jgi:hypothetical protein